MDRNLTPVVFLLCVDMIATISVQMNAHKRTQNEHHLKSQFKRQTDDGMCKEGYFEFGIENKRCIRRGWFCSKSEMCNTSNHQYCHTKTLRCSCPLEYYSAKGDESVLGNDGKVYYLPIRIPECLPRNDIDPTPIWLGSFFGIIFIGFLVIFRHHIKQILLKLKCDCCASSDRSMWLNGNILEPLRPRYAVPTRLGRSLLSDEEPASCLPRSSEEEPVSCLPSCPEEEHGDVEQPPSYERATQDSSLSVANDQLPSYTSLFPTSS